MKYDVNSTTIAFQCHAEVSHLIPISRRKKLGLSVFSLEQTIYSLDYYITLVSRQSDKLLKLPT
jgi:hypothetical protein